MSVENEKGRTGHATPDAGEIVGDGTIKFCMSGFVETKPRILLSLIAGMLLFIRPHLDVLMGYDELERVPYVIHVLSI